jgi:hypothetical protein
MIKEKIAMGISWYECKRLIGCKDMDFFVRVYQPAAVVVHVILVKKQSPAAFIQNYSSFFFTIRYQPLSKGR